MHESVEYALMKNIKSDRVSYLAGKGKLLLGDNSRIYSAKTKKILTKSYKELPEDTPLKRKATRNISDSDSQKLGLRMSRISENLTPIKRGVTNRNSKELSVNLGAKTKHYFPKNNSNAKN